MGDRPGTITWVSKGSSRTGWSIAVKPGGFRIGKRKKGTEDKENDHVDVGEQEA